jgi:hypothetical protein
MSARGAVISIAADRRQLAPSVSTRQIPWSSGRSGMQRARSWGRSTCLQTQRACEQATGAVSFTVVHLGIWLSAALLNRPGSYAVVVNFGGQLPISARLAAASERVSGSNLSSATMLRKASAA